MGKMLTALLLTTLLVSPGLSSSSAIRLGQCILGADFVVLGRVDTSTDHGYSLNVERVLAGKHDRRRIWIEPELRLPRHETGQRLVVFVTLRDGRAVPIGGPREGEILLQHGRARIRVGPGCPAVDEKVLTDAVRAFYSALAAPGSTRIVSNWKSLLRHENPLVVQLAVQEVGERAIRSSKTRFWAQLAHPVADLLDSDRPEIRILAARHVSSLAGPEVAEDARARVRAQLHSKPAGRRLAAALALSRLEPASLEYDLPLLRALAGDMTTGEKRASASSLRIALTRMRTGSKPEHGVADPLILDALRKVRHLALLASLIDYAATLHGDVTLVGREELDDARVRWIKRLQRAPDEE